MIVGSMSHRARSIAGSGANPLPSWLPVGNHAPMQTNTISLPHELLEFIDQQVAHRGYGDRVSFIEEMIWNEKDRSGLETLRNMLLEAANSPSFGTVDPSYFDDLRQWVRECSRSHGES